MFHYYCLWVWFMFIYDTLYPVINDMFLIALSIFNVIKIFAVIIFLARKCPTGILSKLTECQKVGNQLYVLGCDANNWFTAKHVCKSIGAILLPTVPSKDFKLNCKKRLWIGLRKEKWFHVILGRKGTHLNKFLKA